MRDFDGAFRHRQHTLNFAIVQSLQIRKITASRNSRRKLAKSMLHLPARIRPSTPLDPAGARPILFHLREHILDRIGDAVPARAAVSGQSANCASRCVSQVGKAPCVERSWRACDTRGKNLLRQIFGFLTLAREAIAKVVNAASVQADQLRPGDAAAPGTLSEPVDVLFQMSICLRSGIRFQPPMNGTYSEWKKFRGTGCRFEARAAQWRQSSAHLIRVSPYTQARP